MYDMRRHHDLSEQGSFSDHFFICIIDRRTRRILRPTDGSKQFLSLMRLELSSLRFLAFEMHFEKKIHAKSHELCNITYILPFKKLKTKTIF